MRWLLRGVRHLLQLPRDLRLDDGLPCTTDGHGTPVQHPPLLGLAVDGEACLRRPAADVALGEGVTDVVPLLLAVCEVWVRPVVGDGLAVAFPTHELPRRHSHRSHQRDAAGPLAVLQVLIGGQRAGEVVCAVHGVLDSDHAVDGVHRAHHVTPRCGPWIYRRVGGVDVVGEHGLAVRCGLLPLGQLLQPGSPLGLAHSRLQRGHSANCSAIIAVCNGRIASWLKGARG
mmetsp:Transcript_154790/g.475601  ORF Transcript_154790/g.475601 Transcript_154790/m.475601 type:complete len:229 (-) Transcript_154790:97-783(-)